MSGWLVEALIASTLLMAVALLLRGPVRRAFGPQLAYLLWALPALRLALPPLPEPVAAAPLGIARATVLVYVEPVAAAAGTSPATIAAMLWTIGAIGFLAWHSAAHLAFVRRILAPPARRIPLAPRTELVESAAAAGPVAFGIVRRFVAVPADFAERYDADERRLALAHELGHHARGDLIANWVALAVLALHWFNPLAWVAYRAFRADQEMANDARVIAALPVIDRHAYACAIVKAAHGGVVSAACHLHTIEDLKGRLRMLRADRKSRRVMLAGAAGIAGLTLAGLGLTASGAAAEQIRTIAAVQVPLIAAQVAPSARVAPVMPIARDGRELFELSDRTSDDNGKKTRATRLVIRDKDGNTQTYRDAEADAYLAAHPEMRPPAPPTPPVPGVAELPPVPGAAPMPPVPPGVNTRRMSYVINTGDSDQQVDVRDVPEMVETRCGTGGTKPAAMTYTDDAGGKRKMVVCIDRIEKVAAEAAAGGRDAARQGLQTALSGLRAGRAAVAGNREMGRDARRDALAGIDEAIKEIEEEIRSQR